MLTTLRQIVQEVNSEPDLDIALSKMVSNIKLSMKTECCSVYLSDIKNQHYLLKATDGLSQDAVGDVAIGFSEGLIGWVGQREEPINLANANQHPRFKQLPNIHEDKYCAFLGVPIIHQRNVLGILTVQQADSRVFDEDEEAFLVTLSIQLASVLAHVEARKLFADKSQSSVNQSIQFKAVSGAEGVAVGRALIANPVIDFDSVSLRKVYKSEKEIQLFYRAVKQTRKDFLTMSEQMSEHLSSDSLAIFDVYQQMLDAESLGDDVEANIRQGWCAVSALKIVVNKFVDQFSRMEDPYIRERATDVKDLGCRVLGHLIQVTKKREKVTDDVVLVADEVTASMLAEIPRRYLKAIISIKGSVNSHAAIMARGLGIPAVLGVEDIPLLELTDKTVVVDGYSGSVLLSPPEAVLTEYKKLIVEEEELNSILEAEVLSDSLTEDNEPFSLLLNGGLGIDLDLPKTWKADGIGLYRTELPFMMKQYFPSETEQKELYISILKQYPHSPVTLRTLDIGGDKALPYFPIKEENPFLGWRGIRLTLDHPEIFLVQIRALILANVEFGNLNILLPMISDVSEVDEALRLINQAYFELCDEQKTEHKTEQKSGQKAELKIEHREITKPRVGIMIEVPAAVYLLEDLAQKVDFFSVGSNDLTQYLLAVDRNNARVASLYDSFHPAVLRVLNEIAHKSHSLGVPVSICGEIAGDPRGAMLLMAMGYRSLSMNAQNLLKVKYVLRRTSMKQMNDMLVQCLRSTQPNKVRKIVEEQFVSSKLIHLIRAGS